MFPRLVPRPAYSISRYDAFIQGVGADDDEVAPVNVPRSTNELRQKSVKILDKTHTI